MFKNQELVYNKYKFLIPIIPILFIISYDYYAVITRKNRIFDEKIGSKIIFIEENSRGETKFFYDSVKYFTQKDFLIENISDFKINDSVYKKKKSLFLILKKENMKNKRYKLILDY